MTAPITDAELARLEPDEPSDPPAPVTDGDLARMLRKFSDLLNVDDAKRLAWSLREARRERDTAYAKGRADERADRLAATCVCGHVRGLHEGHTHRPGDPEPLHCSQLCGCHVFRYAHVTGAKGKAE